MKTTKFGYRNGSPPPLPPHGVPIIKPQRPDYRPPVPPHRNIGVTANIGQPINGNVEQVSPVLIFSLLKHWKFHLVSRETYLDRAKSLTFGVFLWSLL